MADLSSDAIDVDSLLAEVNAPTPERAMSGPPAPANTEPAQVPTPQQTSAALPVEHEFTWNGQKIKAPQDMILSKYAPMGYDYAQKMQAFKELQKNSEREMQEKYVKPYEKYKTVDDYVGKNPDWWKHVEDQWTQRQTSQDPNFQRMQAVLDEKLKPFQDKLAADEQIKAQEQSTKEDTQLTEDIKSIRAKYPNLDFDAPDTEGKSLEYKVLEHGSRHNFPTFKSAFLDFHHDQLEKMWEARGREAVSKDSQKKAKLGLSVAPQTLGKNADSYNVKGKNYNQLLDEAVQKYGLV